MGKILFHSTVYGWSCVCSILSQSVDLPYRFYLKPSASGDSIHSASHQPTTTDSTVLVVGGAADTPRPDLISFPESSSEDPGEAPASQTATHKRSVHRNACLMNHLVTILTQVEKEPRCFTGCIHLVRRGSPVAGNRGVWSEMQLGLHSADVP